MRNKIEEWISTDAKRAEQAPKRGRTIRLNKKQVPDAAKWVRWLSDNCIGSFGPHGSIVGMRRLYYGKDALIVMAGAYGYFMGKDSGQKMPWEN